MRMYPCKSDYIIEDHIKNGMHLDSKQRIVLSSGKLWAGTARDKFGYQRVGLYDKRVKKGISVKVSRVLCWLYFGPPPYDGQFYDAEHKNQDPSDDSRDNLRWATRSVNTKNSKYYYRGPHAKRSVDTEEAIRDLYNSGVPPRDLAKQFSIPKTTLWRIIRNEYAPSYKLVRH